MHEFKIIQINICLLLKKIVFHGFIIVRYYILFVLFGFKISQKRAFFSKKNMKTYIRVHLQNKPFFCFKNIKFSKIL